MKRPQTNIEVLPVNIREIRQKVGLTTQQMADRITAITQQRHYTHIPQTRISEWEMGHRAVPDYVFTASAYVLLDSWSDDRHMTPPDRQREVDIYYGSVLNKPLGELFKLELKLERSRNQKLRSLVRHVRRARLEQMKNLERVLHVKMAYVFDSEPGPGTELEDVA